MYLLFSILCFLSRVKLGTYIAGKLRYKSHSFYLLTNASFEPVTTSDFCLYAFEEVKLY